MLTFALDRNAVMPLYQQLKQHLIRQIENGLLRSGDRLPSTRDLAEQLGIARISVVTAYDELRAEGYITSQVGRGTFITEQGAANPEGVPHIGIQRSRHGTLRDLLRLAERPDMINFSQGTPTADFLPVELIRQTIDAVLVRDGGSAVAYEVPDGYPPLRETVAQRVRRLGIEAGTEEVLITGGCQQALDLAVQALLNPDDVILTTNPTYAGMLDIADARGVAVIGLPIDDEGMEVDHLEDAILEYRPRLLYLAPTYHNPTGTILPLHRRRYVLEIATRYRLPILEDGVYEELSYSGTPPPPLRALDEDDLVLYASSFSKALLPGMRIGYLLARGGLFQRLARVKRAADICTPALNQRAMHLALESGRLDEHVAAVRKACQQRLAAMIDALRHYLPEAHWVKPSGGLYLWVEIPQSGPTATELYLQAVRVGVAFAMGTLFHTDDQGTHHLRLNIAAYPPEVIEEGIRRLGAVWRELAANHTSVRASSIPFS